MGYRSYCGSGHQRENADASVTSCPTCGSQLYTRCPQGHTFWVSAGTCDRCGAVMPRPAQSPSPSRRTWTLNALRRLQTTSGFLAAGLVLAVILVADAGAMGYTVSSGSLGSSPASFAAPATSPDIPATTTPPTTTPPTTTGTSRSGTSATGTSGTGTTTATSAPPPEGTPPAPMPASVVSAVAAIPGTEYNTVAVSVTPPPGGLHTLSNQPPLVVDGKPGILFMGDEWCPFCAAERWAIVAALSRFGTFGSLGSVTSSTSDVNPGTPSFSFDGATYTSAYVSFEGVELASTQTDSQGQYLLLQVPTPTETRIVDTYESPTFLGPGWTPGSVPFLDVGNSAIFAGSAYSPSLIAGKSAQQVAAGLSDVNLPATRAIVAAANLISAEICRTTGQQPASVCASAGVQAAAGSAG
ncbi:MAG: DUF929 family protein [Acidimicrobiales bacterium]